MSELIIYGASDDLIEVDGDFREEYTTGASGDESVLVAGLDFGGVAVVTPYMNNFDGYWTASTKFYGQAKTWESEAIDRPDYEEGDQGVKLRFPDEQFRVFKIVKY